MAKARAWTRMSSESCVSPQRAKTRVDLLVGLDVARLDEGRPDGLGQGPHALLDQALDRREADLGALGVERLGDPPGDRVVVGDAEDERRLALEQSHPVLRAVSSPGSLPSARWHRIDCATALRGVRGLVLDADGVIVLKGEPLPGSVDAIRSLQDRGIPFRVVTNFSQMHRETLARWMGKSGLAIDPARIITADLGHRRPHRGGPSRPAVAACSPPRTRAASSTASGSSPRTRPMPLPAGEVAAVVHRRCRRRPVVPEHGRRLPAGPGRSGPPGDAPQPVVAHPGRDDPRRGGVRGRRSSSRPASGRRSSASRRPPSSGKPSPGCSADLGERRAAIGVRDGR